MQGDRTLMGRRNENWSRRSEAVGFRTEKRFITEQTVHSRYAFMGILERSRGCKSKALTVLTNRSSALCDKQEEEMKK